MRYPCNNKTEILNTGKATGYLLAETANNDIVELHIQQDGLVPAHALPVDVSFYVVSGKGTITISNVGVMASEGDVIEVKKELERSWQNPFSETLTLLVIKQKA